jgi:hypothetical protein
MAMPMHDMAQRADIDAENDACMGEAMAFNGNKLLTMTCLHERAGVTVFMSQVINSNEQTETLKSRAGHTSLHAG